MRNTSAPATSSGAVLAKGGSQGQRFAYGIRKAGDVADIRSAQRDGQARTLSLCSRKRFRKRLNVNVDHEQEASHAFRDFWNLGTDRSNLSDAAFHLCRLSQKELQ